MKLKVFFILFLTLQLTLARTTQKKKEKVVVQNEESEEDVEESQEDEKNEEPEQEEEEEEDESQEDEVIYSGPNGVRYSGRPSRPWTSGGPPQRGSEGYVRGPQGGPGSDSDSQEDEPIGGGGGPQYGYGPPPSGGGPQFSGGGQGGTGQSMGGGPPIFVQGRTTFADILKKGFIMNRMGEAAGSDEEEEDDTPLVYDYNGSREGRVVSFLRTRMGPDYYNPEYIINPSIALERRNYRLRHRAPPIKPKYHFYKSQHGVWGNPREYDIHPYSGHHYYGGNYYGKMW